MAQASSSGSSSHAPPPKNAESYMKSLFYGQIKEELIFPYPKPNAELSETVRMVVDTIQKFAKDQVKAREWDKAGAMPREMFTKMAELGLAGIAVPEAMGGLGLPQSGYARVMQEIASFDGSLAVTMGAHQSIGYKAVLLFASDEQKQRWLPRLATGELIACYCLTEPGSGSDAASIKTRATLSADGKYYEITGNKLWITNGGIASFMTIFAKTEVIENGEKKEKVSCFGLELPAEGVQVGPPEHKLGIRASWTNAIYFDKVRVPVENVIGGVGQGFKVAMGVLNHGRLGLAAGSVAGMKRCIEASVAHANERVQFKKKIGEFGMIKDKIGRMMMNAYVTESIVYMTTALIDRGDVDYSIESAIAKVFATEALWECVDENLQVWAGAGYMEEYPYEQWLRDSRINRIFEGTNEILRAFIALSGLQGPGQDLASLGEAIKHPLKGLGLVGDIAARTIKGTLVGDSMTQVHPALKKQAAFLEETAKEFATQVLVLLRRHGSKIHEKQFAQKRLADIAIDYYAMSCVVSRVTQTIQAQGSVAKCEIEMAVAEAFLQRAERRVKANFRAIDKNDDDQIKFLAGKAYELGHYPFDVI